MRYIEQIGGRDTMIGHSMISVKAAAALLGCDKRAVREKLDQGQLKGEKRLDGDKEKWFVKRADVEKLMQLSSPPPQNPIITAPPPRIRKRVAAQPSASKPWPTETAKSTPETNDLFFGVEPTIVPTPQTVARQESWEETPGRGKDSASELVIESTSWTTEQNSFASGDIVDTTTVSDYSSVKAESHNVIIDTTTISEAPLFAPSDWTSSSIEYEAASSASRSQHAAPNYDDVVADRADHGSDPYDAALNDADRYDEPLKTEAALMNVIQVMTKEFVKRMEDERSLNARLLEELEVKNAQLRLLPDLQKRADELYKVEFEAAALRLQISCMHQQHIDALVCLERAEHDTIPQLEARLEEECRQHSIEVARLQEQVSLYVAQVGLNENHQKTVVELENALYEAIEQKEREKRQAWNELDRLKRENERYQQLARDEAMLRDKQLSEIERLSQESQRIEREKQFEIDLFVDEVDLLKQERDVALAKLNDRLTQLASQGQNISQLESELDEANKIREQELQLLEEEKKKVQAEAERMTQHWQSEVSSLNDRLSAITDQLKESQKPWWRKWFFPAT